MYRVVLSRQASQYYQSVERKVAVRLRAAFELLEQNPCPRGAKRLHGELDGLWRLRVGGLRIIYEPSREIRIVNVLRIGPRGDVY